MTKVSFISLSVFLSFFIPKSYGQGPEIKDSGLQLTLSAGAFSTSLYVYECGYAPTLHWLSPLMSAFLILYQKVKIKLVKTNLTIKLLDINIAEIDELWIRTSNRFEFTNVRDNLSIQWYAENKILLGIFQGEKLTAMAILDLRKNLKYDNFDLTLVDYWMDYEVSREYILSAIVKFCIKYAQENEISRLRFPHFSLGYSDTYKKIGLLNKKDDHPGYIRIPDFLKISLTNENSYFTLLQGDYGV